MDIKSHIYLSATSSSASEAKYLTSEFFTDVVSSTSHCDVTVQTGCDVTELRNYEGWDTSEICDSESTFDVTGMTSPVQDAPDVNTPAIYDAITTIAAEQPRCLDNSSDVTSASAPSQDLTHLSVGTKLENAVYNVGNDHRFADDDVIQQQFPAGTYSDVIAKRDDERRYDDRMSSETREMMSTSCLPSSEDVETYFSTVDRLRFTETFTTQRHHHHHHHVYYQHHPPQEAFGERLSSPDVSFSSSSSSTSTSDVKQQFYASLYNYSADEHHRQHVMQMSLPLQHSLVTAADYHQSAVQLPSNGSTSLTDLMPVHVTASETANTCRSTPVPMLCYSPSTTTSSLMIESHGEGGSDDDGVSGSFSALLHSSPVSHHADLSLSATSARYGSECGGTADFGVDVSDRRHAADVSLPYYSVMQPTSCCRDDQMTAWSSPGIVTLMKSFAGTVVEYRGLSLNLLVLWYSPFSAICYTR